MAEGLERMFGKTARVLVKDGEFNEVQGEFHHYDYSHRVTNNGSYNITGSTIHNVGNIRPQVIYHDERGSHSMHGHPTSSSVTTVYARDNHVPSPYPQSQVPIPNYPNQLPYGHIVPQNPGQYVYAQSGEIRQMTAVQSSFMNSQMAYMLQEIASEFSGDNERNTPEDDISAATRDLSRLAIDGPSSSPRSALIHASSSTAARPHEGPRHIIIPGDYTEVDNNFYQSNFDSFKNKNNIIENSFGVRQKFVNVPQA